MAMAPVSKVVKSSSALTGMANTTPGTSSGDDMVTVIGSKHGSLAASKFGTETTISRARVDPNATKHVVTMHPSSVSVWAIVPFADVQLSRVVVSFPPPAERREIGNPWVLFSAT